MRRQSQTLTSSPMGLAVLAEMNGKWDNFIRSVKNLIVNWCTSV